MIIMNLQQQTRQNIAKDYKNVAGHANIKDT